MFKFTQIYKEKWKGTETVKKTTPDPPILKFLKRYKGQVILGSVVTGVWLGYQWIPQTVLLPWLENRYSFYSIDGSGDLQREELNSSSLSLIEQVKADLRARGVKEKCFERCRVFKMNSTGWMYHCGTTRVGTGAIIGIPFIFELNLPQMIPYIRKMKATYDITKIEWDSEAGQQYIQNLLLSDSAKKYAIAWQFNYANSYYLFGKTFLGVSVFVAYFIQSMQTQMKVFKRENIHKLLHRQQVLMNKRLGYKKAFSEAENYGIVRMYAHLRQVRLAIAFIALYHILYYSYRWNFDKSIDRKTGKLGEEYLHGGIEFYGKVLERNKAQRELMDIGPQYFKENGDNKQGYLFNLYWPDSKARDYLMKMLEKSATASKSSAQF